MPDDDSDELRRRRYRDPPVVEAIARFQWAQPVSWTLTTPGLLFEQLREDYPEEPQAQTVMSAGLFPPQEGGQASGGGMPAVNTEFEVRAGPQRILFSQKSRTRLLGASPTDLSVHGLPPYEGWESLEKRLIEGVERIAPVLGDGPTVSLVGLRYINRVEIPESATPFEEYLTITLSFPPGYPSQITGFLDRVEMQYPDENVKLAFTWASTDAPEDSLAFVLDLDLYAACPEPMAVQDAIQILKDLKLKEGRAFEALLRDKIREQFGEIND